MRLSTKPPLSPPTKPMAVAVLSYLMFYGFCIALATENWSFLPYYLNCTLLGQYLQVVHKRVPEDFKSTIFFMPLFIIYQISIYLGEIEYEAPSESTYNTEEDLSAPDLVDFSPVYRCLHIYTVLGEQDIYERYYR